MTLEKELSIPLDTGDSVSAVLHLPEPPPSPEVDSRGVVIAHGMSNDMNNPLIVAMARGLAQNGVGCLRFNFLYRERQKKSADPEHRLIHTFAQAMARMKKEIGSGPLIAAGKSLGARMAAQAAANGDIAPKKLIFLGYPLHAPGRKDKLRDAPLYRIKQPMLFFEGTRDPFCDLALMDKVLEKITTPVRLNVVDNGDHGFGLPKSDPRPREEIFSGMLETCLDWL
ncbi:MAG: dienelactone hydrolase family protein [Desulfobacter sp.]|nr:MAG: dienelactone hydrolase family protein [Desulfobacter sp.]